MNEKYNLFTDLEFELESMIKWFFNYFCLNELLLKSCQNPQLTNYILAYWVAEN